MVYRFGTCLLDPQRHRLLRDGQIVRLRAKAFQLLCYVLEHRDRTVLKSELYEAIWPQAFISEATLESTLRTVRQAIGDTGRAQQLIQTVYGYGYRFVAAVEVCTDAPHEASADAVSPLPDAIATPRPDNELSAVQAPVMPEVTTSDDDPHVIGTGDNKGFAPPEGAAALTPDCPVTPSPVWEQKPVAVLAIDFAFPAATVEGRGVDEPCTAARRWEQAIIAKARAFGGVVLQGSPSLCLIAFGIPRTLEQMPQRAVQVALALRQWVLTDAATGPCPELRMAVHWGQLLVDTRPIDLAEPPRPIGETLAWPVRLLGQAAPGEVLLSPEVAAQVEGWYALQVRRVSLRGSETGRLGVYALVGSRPQRPGLEMHGRRPLSRFVGREQELATLGDCLRQVEAGRGQVLGLIGEPGVGKSRLCHEVSWLPRTHGWLILQSSPTAYSKDIPYFPVVDLLKTYFRLDTRDEPQTIHDKITTKLQTLDEGLRESAPPLLALLDLPVEDRAWQALEPSQRRQRTLDALKRLLVRESQVRPVLLIVENLHWIDTETQAFLDGLVNSLPAARILLLVNYRPEYQHRWGSKTYYMSLRLASLGLERAAELLRSLIGEDPTLAPLNQYLIEKTEGNPFFLEESIRTLVEAQVLVGVPGAYRLAHAVQNLRVPATVQAVLAARIDLLAPEDKRLLQMAAVIGNEVPFALLRELAELSHERLLTGLLHLQAAEFLYETHLFPEPSYTFKHALTHEVAYGSLLHERRRALHARLVEVLETLAADRLDDQVERLAHHALRGEVWEKVVPYAHRAGTRAADHSAYGQAGAFFDQALDALAHLPEGQETRTQALDLHGARFSMHAARRELELMLACSEKMWSIAEALRDPHRQTRALDYMGNSWSQMGDNTRALEFTQRALALAETVGTVDLLVHVRLDMGILCRAIGDYRRGASVLTQAVELLRGDLARERFGRPLYPAVIARQHLATCLAALGEFRQALSTAEEGLQIAEALQHPGNLIWAHLSYCEPLLQQGRFHDAVPRLERAMALYTPDLSAWYSMIAGPLGFAYAMTGRLAEALPLLERAVERARRVDRRRETQWLAYLSEVYLRAGRPDDAHAMVERLLALGRARGEQSTEAKGRYLFGEIAMQCEPLQAEAAQAYYRKALALADDLGMRPLMAHCHLGLGALYVKTYQWEHARAELRAAIDLYRAMDMTFWLPQAKTALARIGR